VTQCEQWLRQDPANVIAIHCKGGKGRTVGVVGQTHPGVHLRLSPAEGGNRRLSRGGVTVVRATTYQQRHEEWKGQNPECFQWAKIGGFSAGPSQIRYVFYYNYLYTHVRCAPKLHLKRLEIPVGKNRVFFRS
jgi:hypothetical protein